MIGSSSAQVSNIDSIVNVSFGQKPELYFIFPVQDHNRMIELSQMVSIDNVKNGEVIAIANKKQFSLFLEQEIPYTILLSPNEMLPPEAWVMTDNMTNKSTNAWDVYPTYQAYIDLMVQFATDYPNLCRLDTIGYAVSGRLLLAAVISDNVHTDEYEPEFLYTSSMHGDEITGYVLMLRLIDYLLTNYGTIPDVTNLVNNVEIYINPNANPDGTYFNSPNGTSVASARRNNLNNEDLNRNYPVPDGTAGDDGTYAMEPETQYFVNWGLERDFVMSANIHGGIELMNYPWDYTLTNHPDKQWWIMVSTEYATSAQNNSPSGYFDEYLTGFDSPGVTEGASWYIVKGSRQDYMQYFADCREVTLEISNTKMPAASTLPSFWNYNYQAFILYMKQVLYGYKGLVTDGCSGQPIEAKIELVGHDALNSHIFSSLPIGNYHRPVKAGTYTIKASAAGYVDQQYTNVAITDYNTVVRDFQLMPIPPAVQFAANIQSACEGIVEFQNNSVSPQDVIYTWYFGDGNTSSDVNPVHTYTANGIYTVKLVAESCAGNDSLTIPAFVDISIPALPLTSDTGRCGAGSLTLNASSPGQILWWDATGTTQLASGTTYITPLLNQTTQYFVSSLEAEPPCFGGKADNSGNGIYFTSATEHGLIFTAHKPLTINTAVVYAQTAGNKTFTIKNASNTVLSSVTVNVPAGQSTITLGLEVPMGTGLKLMGPVSPGLFRSESTANIGYPYELCDLMTITSSTAGTNPTYYYYYFYNIEAEAQTTLFGALTNKTTNGGYYDNALSHGLYFNCTEEVTLKSVKVYANQAGNRTISLKDGSDNLIENVTVNIPNGESRITLNLNIPVGNNLRLMGPETPYLWRDGTSTSANLAYPFSVGDVISITGNSANNVKYYYYFYDWEIEKVSGCESQKIPVTAYIYTNPDAAFIWTENSLEVTFTNQSTGGGTYLWNFGDGNTSTEVQPVHTYSSSGSYTVTLTITNDCGTDVFTDQIGLTTVSVMNVNKNLKIFPNPVEDYFIIRHEDIMINAELFNIQGVRIASYEIENSEKVIDTRRLSSGTYLIRVYTDSEVLHGMIQKY